MSQITWNDSYSVDNVEVDSQHKEWIAIYNKLDHTLLNGSNQEVSTLAADSLQAMQEYADYHFRDEEKYMREINFPFLVEHRRLHTDFEDELYTYNRSIRSGELILNTEVISIVKNWLLNHILLEDQKYHAFLTRDYCFP
jgi:hemerythrin